MFRKKRLSLLISVVMLFSVALGAGIIAHADSGIMPLFGLSNNFKETASGNPVSIFASDTTKPTGSITSTNFLDTTQKVMFQMSDDKGIAGFYWGTNSNYSKNTYKSVLFGIGTAFEIVSKPGTYYLTVKDTSGNLSNPCSMTFYKTTFNANGGTTDWEYILTVANVSIDLPTPTRNDYVFKGWNPSKSASTGVTSISPSGNGTYYAIWKVNDSVKPTGSISSTNKVAASQTATLTLSDNIGVDGYYWGTSPNYSSNTYTSASEGTVTKTISSSGTYYLTVKDKGDNLSDTVSVTYYKTTLNANGGSVSPSSVLTKSGNTFTFPTPSKGKASYLGWSTSQSATSGVKSLTPTGNATYYAIWKEGDSTKPTGSITSTNNVAASQTATLTLSDNVGVAGYYWGTNSKYSSNTYTSASAGSVKKSVKAAGVYYLTVKDVSGNISNTVSIRYYKTTLNANGGSVSPSSVLTKSGNTFTFPTAKKTGYACKGWNTSKSASSGISSLKPTANKTYYALWKKGDTTKPTGSISSTNKVSSSQTATLTLSDNKAVAGYYWGTSSSYSSNIYSSASAGSVSKTVSSSGTYYLTVKDTSGNLSTTVSIKYIKTTLNANGGSVSPSSVLTKNGNSFTFPTPSKNGYAFKGWSTSKSASSGIKSLKPTENKTYYAVWNNNIYNLKDETYSFENYEDWHSGGHCFGMSATSSGYYIGKLNRTELIGGDPKASLYSFSLDESFMPICYYQEIQGSCSTNAIVAGGTAYKSGYFNASGDWNSVVNYVKSHKYDNSGALQVGMYKDYEGGHAVNFLYYKVVDGEDRIYIYDNNYPNQELYLCKSSNGRIYEKPYATFSGYLDCVALRDVAKYFNYADSFDNSRAIYAETGTINVLNNALATPMDGKINGKNYTMYEFPKSVDIAVVLPLVENAEFVYQGIKYSLEELVGKGYGILSMSDSGISVDFSSFNFDESTGCSEHSMKEYSIKPTCTDSGYKVSACTECGYIDKDSAGTIDPTGHIIVKDEAVAPTCTERGFTEGNHCELCGEVIKAQTEIPATGHTVVTDKAVEATFKHIGVTEGSHCSVCNEVLVAQKYVAKLGSPSISSITVGKKSFKAIWKSVANIDGYQLQYSTDKNFKSGVKTVNVTGSESASKTVSNLKSSKKYYVRIRGYKKINGSNQYSSWSSKKSATTK